MKKFCSVCVGGYIPNFKKNSWVKCFICGGTGYINCSVKEEISIKMIKSLKGVGEINEK